MEKLKSMSLILRVACVAFNLLNESNKARGPIWKRTRWSYEVLVVHFRLMIGKKKKLLAETYQKDCY